MILFSILGVLIIGAAVVPYESSAFIALTLLTIIAAIACLITHAAIYWNQINSIECIKECEAGEAIYKEQAEVLTGEFKLWLGEKYPDIERGIFKDLISENITIFAAKFPEIKSSETIMDLVSRINGLQNNVYSKKLNIERHRKKIRVAKRNPWIIRKIIPTE